MVSLKVLVIEDNKATLRLTEVSLKAMGFTEIITAENGRIALEIIRKSKPDIILSDWDMPEMSGIELLAKIRSDKSLKDIPFIIQSNNRNQEHIVEAVNTGVDSYIIKPYESSVLKQKITEVLSKYKKI